MPKGKWAQGITPRNFHWVITDRLAVCERPGGYGESHRKVRRQEEIIWIREQGFHHVVSLSASPHNLHNYDELGVAWLHRPFPRNDDLPPLIRHRTSPGLARTCRRPTLQQSMPSPARQQAEPVGLQPT